MDVTLDHSVDETDPDSHPDRSVSWAEAWHLAGFDAETVASTTQMQLIREVWPVRSSPEAAVEEHDLASVEVVAEHRDGDPVTVRAGFRLVGEPVDTSD